MLSCFAFLVGVGLVLRAPRSPSALALLDATVLLVTCSASGSMALAPYVEDHPRDPVFRAAMAVMMTVIFRAVIVPSSSRRTLLLSLLAIPVPLALTALVYAREGGGAAHMAPHLVWTGFLVRRRGARGRRDLAGTQPAESGVCLGRCLSL